MTDHLKERPPAPASVPAPAAAGIPCAPDLHGHLGTAILADAVIRVIVAVTLPSASSRPSAARRGR